MANLKDKLDTLTVQLGLTRDAPAVEVIDQALKHLGLEERASNLNLVQKADLCLAALGSSSCATAPSQPVVVVQGTVVPSPQPGPAYGQPTMAQQIAPVPQQIARPQIDRPQQIAPSGTIPLDLDGIALTGDCCCLFPPPVFVCCCSDITRGDASSKVSVQYNAASGMLLRPEMCNQRLHVEWGRYTPGSKVLSFHCGLFDCPDNEQWDLFSDGTIRPRHHSHLVVGVGHYKDGSVRTILVPQDDPQRMVFRSVQQQVTMRH